MGSILVQVIAIQSPMALELKLHAKGILVLNPTVISSVIEEFTPGIGIKPNMMYQERPLKSQTVSVTGGILPIDEPQFDKVPI